MKHWGELPPNPEITAHNFYFGPNTLPLKHRNQEVNPQFLFKKGIKIAVLYFLHSDSTLRFPLKCNYGYMKLLQQRLKNWQRHKISSIMYSKNTKLYTNEKNWGGTEILKYALGYTIKYRSGVIYYNFWVTTGKIK